MENKMKREAMGVWMSFFFQSKWAREKRGNDRKMSKAECWVQPHNGSDSKWKCLIWYRNYFIQ